MKNIAITSAATVLLAATSYGDITYSMPGLSQAGEIKDSSRFDATVNVGENWGYKITGYSWRIVASTPVVGGFHQNGDYTDEDGSKTTLTSRLSVTIDGEEIITGSLTASSSKTNQGDDVIATGSHTFETPLTYTEEDIEFLITQSSQMTDDAGTYVIIHGEAIKSAPVPTGELAPFDLEATDSEKFYYAEEGTIPIIHFKVDKIGTITTEPPINVASTAPIPPRDNNGIGNNYNSDGDRIMYDPDNTGQAKKYFDGGLEVPADGELDIEGNQ